MERPTEQAYGEMQYAYDFFNIELFNNELPDCLITMQRTNGAYGYFSPNRFTTKDGKTTDEIAMNPIYFAGRTLEELLSTLVHEMVHLWQHRFGKPGRQRYHNREWAERMVLIGLQPSSTGKPGGKEVGDSMSHYIINDGPFSQAFQKLKKSDFAISWTDSAGVLLALFGGSLSGNGKNKTGIKKRNRAKYTCSACKTNVWGKPNLHLLCGDCEKEFEAVV